MKQSLQDKAAFFAQYWGQRIRKWDGMPNYMGLVSSTYMTKYATEGCYLELTPLSDITDEDAIEVAKIMGVKNSDFFTDQFSRFRDKDELNYALVGKSYMEYFLEENKWKAKSVWYISQLSIVKSFDHLRSRGYLLPFRQYSTQQLLDMGWVKIKKP